MEDKRRFSKIVIYDEKQHFKMISKLGIDIFDKDFTLNNFKSIINSKNTMTAPLLLKQEIVRFEYYHQIDIKRRKIFI